MDDVAVADGRAALELVERPVAAVNLVRRPVRRPVELSDV
jgi:hypothetical protein